LGMDRNLLSNAGENENLHPKARSGLDSEQNKLAAPKERPESFWAVAQIHGSMMLACAPVCLVAYFSGCQAHRTPGGTPPALFAVPRAMLHAHWLPGCGLRRALAKVNPVLLGSPQAFLTV